MRPTGWKFRLIVFLLPFILCSLDLSIFKPPYRIKEWFAEKELSSVAFWRGRVYACSRDGTLYSATEADTVLKAESHLGVELVDMAVWDDQLFLLSPQGLLNLKGERLLSFEGGLALVPTVNRLFLLSRKELVAFQSPFRLRLKGMPVAVRRKGEYIGLLTDGAFYLVNSNSLSVAEFKTGKLEVSSFLTVKDRTLLDIEGGKAIFLRSSSPVQEVVVVDLNSRRELERLRFRHRVSALGFWKSRAFAVESLKDPSEGYISRLHLLSGAKRSLLIPYFVSRAFSMGQLLVLTGELGLFEIFFGNLQYRHSITFPSNNVIIARLIQVDTDGNGEEDFLVTGFSNLPYETHRWKGVGLLRWNLKEARSQMLENIRAARRLNRKLRLWAALSRCEAAMEVAQFLAPEIVPELIKLHRSIMRKISIWLYIKSNFSMVLLWLVLVVMGLTMAWLYRRLRMSGDPPDRVLEDLSGSNFSHQVMHLLKSLLETPDREFERKYREVHPQLKQLYHHFLSYQNYFSSSSAEWWSLYRKVRKHLGKFLRAAPSRSRTAQAYEAVKNFAFKLRSMRGSVIEDALKPAINSILPAASERGIKIELDLQPSSGIFGCFYPEKLTEFRNAFYAMLQNCLEAFDNFTPPGQEPVISISSEESFYNVLIVISDNGKGMDERTRKLMFTPGFSTKRKEGGYGLAGVDRLFREWGTIEVISSPGQGTTIKINMELKK